MIVLCLCGAYTKLLDIATSLCSCQLQVTKAYVFIALGMSNVGKIIL